MAATKQSKDEQNIDEVLQKLADMPYYVRPVMQRMHEVIMAAAPDLKPRIWYGMRVTPNRPAAPCWSSFAMTSG